MTRLLFFGGHLLFVVALTATAWVLGRRLTRGLAFADRLESFAVATSLGLGALDRRRRLRRPRPRTVRHRSTFLLARVLLDQMPEYAAVDHSNRVHGDSYTLHGLSRPRLHYHADGELIGSRLGPFDFRKVRRAFGDSRELHRRLTTFGADHLLFVATASAGTLPRDPAFAELFSPVLEGEGFVLYRLAEAAG